MLCVAFEGVGLPGRPGTTLCITMGLIGTGGKLVNTGSLISLSGQILVSLSGLKLSSVLAHTLKQYEALGTSPLMVATP